VSCPAPKDDGAARAHVLFYVCSSATGTAGALEHFKR